MIVNLLILYDDERVWKINTKHTYIHVYTYTRVCMCTYICSSICDYLFHRCVFILSAPEEKADLPQTMNALMKLNQLKPGLQYKLVSQTGPVHVPVFTMSVEVDGTVFEASGPSKRTAKLHVAVKVRVACIQYN